MPNLYNGLKMSYEKNELNIPVFTIKEESKIKGNTDGIRVFTQKYIEFNKLFFIYSTFAKNKMYRNAIIKTGTSLLNFKSYYYTPFFINIPNRIYVLRSRINDKKILW